ncbi:hypothetical protein ACTND3_02890 [Bacillota bacterium HCP28S3_F12]
MMRKMDFVPQEDALLFDEDREKFDAIINRVKKFEEAHPNSFQLPVSDEDALVVCGMIGFEMEYEFAKRDIKNAKSEEEKKTAESGYFDLVYFAFEQLGWYLY